MERAAATGSTSQPRNADPAEVIEQRLGRAGSQGDVEEDRSRRRAFATADAPELVHEHANPLVARPRQAEPPGLGAEPAVHLRDRELRVVDPIERLEEAVRDPRREDQHQPSLRLTPPPLRLFSVPEPSSNTVLRTGFGAGSSRSA